MVVPVSDFMRLRALELAARPQELEDAEVMYDITAEAVSVWHLGRSWAGSQDERIPGIDGLELG